MTTAAERIATKYRPLVVAIVQRSAVPRRHLRDVIQEAFLRLVRVAPRYEPHRSLKGFVAFHVKCAVAEWHRDGAGSLLRVRRGPDVKGQGVFVAQFAEVGEDEHAVETPDPRDPFERIDLRDEVEVLMGPFPARAKRVLRRYYLDSRTQAQVAGELGLSQSRVSQIIKKCKETVNA